MASIRTGHQRSARTFGSLCTLGEGSEALFNVFAFYNGTGMKNDVFKCIYVHALPPS